MRAMHCLGLPFVLLVAGLRAQHDAPAHPPAPAAETKPAGEQKRGSRAPATHTPRLELHPLVLFEHVKAGNEAAAAAAAKRKPMPEPQARPAGAGRYVCAVVACSDCDVDVPQLLGLRREDVLLISVPGPFADAELVAQLERAVRDDGLRLVLVLGHVGCRLHKPADDALGKRVAVARQQAERQKQPLGQTIVQMQRELLLAASELLQQRTGKDELRVFPGEIDAATRSVQWHHTKVDAMPLLPVK